MKAWGKERSKDTTQEQNTINLLRNIVQIVCLSYLQSIPCLLALLSRLQCSHRVFHNHEPFVKKSHKKKAKYELVDAVVDAISY